MSSKDGRILLAYSVFLLAGIGGLGCQFVWARMFLAGMGHEMPALVAVIAAYMCGFGLGSWALDGAISRSRRPVHWFAVLQGVSGMWGLIAACLIPWLSPNSAQWLGTNATPLMQWSVVFCVTTLVLLPATAALGASFPAMERSLAVIWRPGRHVAALYAVNTLGAVIGVVMAVGWLMPSVGLRSSAFCFAAVPLVGAALSLWLARDAAPIFIGAHTPSHSEPAYGEPGRSRLLGTLLMTGLLGMGYQLLTVRVLAQVLDNTIYTYATVLAVYLAGTAIGAAVYRRVISEHSFHAVFLGLCGTLAGTCLLGIILLGRCGDLAAALHATLPASWGGRAVGETTMVMVVFLAPAMVMGAMWSHLVQAARRADGGIGEAIAVNAAGSALAPWGFGVLLLPILGANWSLALTAVSYLGLAPRPRGWQWAWVTGPLGLIFLLPSSLRVLELPRDAELIAWRESLLGTVAVVGEADQSRTLRVDNRFQMGGTGSTEMAARHAHLALLMHPAPKRSLVLGVGTGLTLGATTLYPGLRADGVELVPQVVELMPLFEPQNRLASRHPQITMHTADARRFVLGSREVYDVVIGDLFHPGRDGAALLYTREHFEGIRRRLAPGGLYCQWLPMHQMGQEPLRLITRTFLQVFPETHAWILQFNVEVPVVGLVGYTIRPRFHPRWIEERLESEALHTELRAFALADSLRFLGHWLAGPTELRAFAGPGPLNTDDHPRLLFLAPRHAVSSATEIHGRLEMLLRLRPDDIAGAFELVNSADLSWFDETWKRYAEARDIYLAGLVHEAEERRGLAIDAFIESARISRDFTAGYARVLALVSMLAPDQSENARALLERLAEAQPAIPVARQMLDRIVRQ